MNWDFSRGSSLLENKQLFTLKRIKEQESGITKESRLDLYGKSWKN